MRCRKFLRVRIIILEPTIYDTKKKKKKRRVEERDWILNLILQIPERFSEEGTRISNLIKWKVNAWLREILEMSLLAIFLFLFSIKYVSIRFEFSFERRFLEINIPINIFLRKHIKFIKMHFDILNFHSKEILKNFDAYSATGNGTR